MCCLIAITIRHMIQRRRDAFMAKQQKLQDPVLFYVDLLLRLGNPQDEQLDWGADRFSLEEASAAEDALVSVMKGETRRSFYSGEDADRRRAEVVACLQRIVQLLAKARRRRKDERFRHIRISATSVQVARLIRAQRNEE